MKKRFLTTLCALAIAASLIGCEKTRDLTSESKSEEVTKLQDKYDSLSDDYSELKKKYENLQDDYDDLKKQLENTTTEQITTTEKPTTEQATTETQPADLSGYASNITYDQLARTPKDYEGKNIKMSGEVLQLMEGTDATAIRMATDSSWDDVIYIEYDPSITNERILEGDKITVYGMYCGIFQYESTLGGMISVPSIYVHHIERK